MTVEMKLKFDDWLLILFMNLNITKKSDKSENVLEFIIYSYI